MRILCTAHGSASHVQSFVPLVRALRAVGHRVLVAVPPELVPALRGVDAEVAEVFPSTRRFIEDRMAANDALPPGPPGEMTAAYASDRVATSLDSSMWRDGATALLPVAREFGPDLVLRDDFEFAGYLVAEALGVAHVTVPGGVTNVLDLARVPDPVDLHGSALGVERAWDGNGLYRFGRIDYLPERFSFAAAGMPEPLRFREPVVTRPGDRLPEPVDRLSPDRPLVLVSMGSALASAARLGVLPSGMDPVRLVRNAITALSDVDCEVLVTLGGGDPDEWTCPENVHVVRYLPQPLVLEVADVFVTHAGFSGVREAIRTGVPMVACPQMAEQPCNAQRVAELGLGHAVFDADPDALRAAVRSALGEGTVRRSARRAKRDVLRLDDIDAAPAALETLAGKQ